MRDELSPTHSIHTASLCLSLLLGSLPYKNSENRRRGVRVVPRAVSQATSIQSPSLNISQPVTFTSPPHWAFVAHATHTKAYHLRGLNFSSVPSLLGNLKCFFSSLSFFPINIFLFLLIFFLFFTESERELPHDGHVWYLPNYSYIRRCFVAVHDLNLNIWSSFSVPSCITKRLWKFSFNFMCFFFQNFPMTTQII